MPNSKSKLNFEPNTDFDILVRNRIHAHDFAQPQPSNAYYKNRANMQITIAIKAIRNATNQHDFITATAQANAYINAALDYEFIDLAEKGKWLVEVADAVRVQTIGESA
ncbi:hypothetical protein [Acinetobacter tandoii]|uniref:hypothetical protein n=1 Tax=Acinetobacter tandoii TaxID=202954 RepID=UPI00301B2A6A